MKLFSALAPMAPAVIKAVSGYKEKREADIRFVDTMLSLKAEHIQNRYSPEQLKENKACKKLQLKMNFQSHHDVHDEMHKIMGEQGVSRHVAIDMMADMNTLRNWLYDKRHGGKRLWGAAKASALQKVDKIIEENIGKLLSREKQLLGYQGAVETRADALKVLVAGAQKVQNAKKEELKDDIIRQTYEAKILEKPSEALKEFMDRGAEKLLAKRVSQYAQMHKISETAALVRMHLEMEDRHRWENMSEADHQADIQKLAEFELKKIYNEQSYGMQLHSCLVGDYFEAQNEAHKSALAKIYDRASGFSRADMCKAANELVRENEIKQQKQSLRFAAPELNIAA